MYLADNVTPAQRQAIERTLATGNVVAERIYVSKADALARFRKTFADLASDDGRPRRQPAAGVV